MVTKILVPIDFSEFSDKALRSALIYCDKFGAELHLLHVLENRISGPAFGMGLAVPLHEEESSAEVMKELEKLPKDPGERTIIRAAVKGSPFQAIVDYAKENGIELIVLGTHGRTGISHVLLGSVAENVSRHAPCSVMIVR